MSRRGRGGEDRREARRAAKLGGGQPPWSRFRVPIPPLALLDDGQLERIDDAAFRILEEAGLEFLNDRALDILARHGADVDRSTRLVRFDRGLIREYVARAPESFTLHARNPERDLTIGGDWVNFSTVSGPPNVSDLERGRRPGSYEAQVEIIKLHHCMNVLHLNGGTPVAAIDLPAESRHLDYYRAQILYTDRPWQPSAIGRDRIEDGVAMVAMARGVSRERMLSEPSAMTVLNTNSPRRVDDELVAGTIHMAENGQVTIVTPFTLCGAMSPVTVAGALAQQSAEALAAIAFIQMVRAGAPVMFGGFTSNVDMTSGAPAFGTPEYVRAVIIGGQIARRWKLPYRSSNVCSSNTVDAQAAFESMMSLWATILSHANVVHHGTGWLEGGLVASFEKSVLDADMIAAMRAWLGPMDLSEDALAVEAIKAVPPGGHFFGADHTMARYETAFHRSMLADLRPYQTWAEDGARDAMARAHRVWKALLAGYEQPPLDRAAAEAIDAYVARRKEEIARGG
jgi:trimethylamine--corrinoid protein Co-methyltransferase